MKSCISIIGLAISIIPFVFSSCTKNDEEEITPLSAHNVYLKTLPLIQIKGYLLGTWKLHYAFGGLFSQRKNYANAKIDFVKGNEIKWMVNDTSIVQSPINWIQVKDIAGVNTFIMQCKTISGVPVSLGADQILNDTLILYTNGYDGYQYYLTR